jgi:AcrR family transcriptional regulator
MKNKDNTVNIKISGDPKKPEMRPVARKAVVPGLAPARAYHHGDLRLALLEAGLRLLQERDAQSLGLREVAREVGVSPTAIYRHFPDKAALMLALAHEGLERLGAAQQAAMLKAKGGQKGLVASGLTYVRFAADNPALFRLIFSYVPPISPLDADLDEVGLAMRGLREGIRQALPPEMGERQQKAVVLHAWGLVHGLAELVLAGHVAKDWVFLEAVISGTSMP